MPRSMEVLWLMLPLTALAQLTCEIENDPMYVYEEQDQNYPDAYVWPVLSCQKSQISVQLNTTYPDGLFGGNGDFYFNSVVYLYYECKGTPGPMLNRSGEVPGASGYALNRELSYNISLPMAFANATEYTCEVFGCYVGNSDDFRPKFFSIQNRSCIYREVSSTTVIPTTTITVEPTTAATSVLSTSMVSLTTATVNLPTSSTASPGESDIVPTPTPTVPPPSNSATSRPSPTPRSNYTLESNQTNITPHSTTTPPSNQATTPEPQHTGVIVAAAVSVIALLLAVATCTMVIVVLVLRHQQEKRRQILLRYYDYSEPIDPYFNPIDITAQVKIAPSMASVFDTFFPYHAPQDSTDDDRSEVLQCDGTIVDNASIKSMKFASKTETPPQNDQTVVNSNEGSAQETKPEEKDPISDNTDTNKQIQSGYVPANYLMANKNQPVPKGYVTENSLPSSAQQHNGEYVKHADIVRLAPKSLNHNPMGQITNRFRSQLSSTTSSGYVTNLNTPSESRLLPGTPNSGVVMANPSPTHQQMFKSVDKNLVTIEPHIISNDTNKSLKSMKLGDSVEDVDGGRCVDEPEFAAVSGIAEQLYVDKLVAECSFTLNPLHFDPINDEELEGHSSPTYINIASGVELYQSDVEQH